MGYQRQMWFIRWDSSVTAFGKENTNEEASVWLTAMTLKALTDLRAQNIEVDKLIHLNMHAWLAKKHVEGAYHPTAPLDSRFSQVYLTATVIRALESYESVHQLETPNDALSKARAWLTAQSPTSSLDILKKSIALAQPLPEVEHVDGCVAEGESTEMSALMLNALLDADDVSERPQKYRRCVLETMSENAQFGDAATSITSIEALIRYEGTSKQMIDAIVKSDSHEDVRVMSDLQTVDRLPTTNTFTAEIEGKGEVLVGLLSSYTVLAHNLNRCGVSGSIDQSTLRLSISFRCDFTAGFVTLRTWTGTSPRKFVKKFTNEGEPFDGVVHSVTDDEDRRKITYWYSNFSGARLLDVEVLKEFDTSSTDPGYLEICETVSMRVGDCFIMPLGRKQVNIIKPTVGDITPDGNPTPEPKRSLSAGEIAGYVVLSLMSLLCCVGIIKKLVKKKGTDERYDYSKKDDLSGSPKKQPSFLGPEFSPSTTGSRMRRGENRPKSESSAAKVARGQALE